MIRNKKGFTLIEIVIVIVIIAILSAILVPNLTRWITKAKISVLKSEADSVRNAVASQILYEKKDGLDIVGTTQDDFGPEFWSELSKVTSSEVQCTDPKKDGYVQFEVIAKGIINFSYSKGGHIANFDGYEWQYD